MRVAIEMAMIHSASYVRYFIWMATNCNLNHNPDIHIRFHTWGGGLGLGVRPVGRSVKGGLRCSFVRFRVGVGIGVRMLETSGWEL